MFCRFQQYVVHYRIADTAVMDRIILFCNIDIIVDGINSHRLKRFDGWAKSLPGPGEANVAGNVLLKNIR